MLSTCGGKIISNCVAFLSKPSLYHLCSPLDCKMYFLCFLEEESGQVWCGYGRTDVLGRFSVDSATVSLIKSTLETSVVFRAGTSISAEHNATRKNRRLYVANLPIQIGKYDFKFQSLLVVVQYDCKFT